MKNQTEHPGNEGHPVDDYFKNALGAYQPSPPARIWNQISRTLLYRELVRLNFTNIPRIIPISAMIGVTLVAFYFLLPGDDSPALENKTSEVHASTGITTATSQPVTTTNFSSTTATHKELTIIPGVSSSGKTAVSADPGLSRSAGTVVTASEPVVEQMVSAPVSSSYSEQMFQRLSSQKPFLLLDNGSYAELNGLSSMDFPRTSSPSFFSASFEVSPEMTWYDPSTSSPKEVTYWTKAGLTYHFSRFTLSTGIGYGYSTTEQKYRVNYRSNDSIGFFTSVVSFYVDPSNPSEIIFNTKNTTVYDSIDHLRDDRSRTRYSYLRIPLLLGFDLLQTERMTLNFHAGPALTLMIGEKKAEPFIDYPNSRIIRIDSPEPARIKTGVQLWTGLRLDYQLMDQFSIYAEPTFKYYIRTDYKQNEIPEDEPYSIGLGVGIQYNFGKK